MSSGISRPRLRTKTGCLTCRQRRKKCDEKTPACGGCSLSQRSCRWPTSGDLLDRRFALYHLSRHTTTKTTPTPSDASPLSLTGVERYSHVEGSYVKLDKVQMCRRSEWPWRVGLNSQLRLLLTETAASHVIISRNLELVISRHFIERYYSLLLLPNCHPDFYDGWIMEIQDLMVDHKSLYYSVLACAASHIHFIDENSPMQERALTYYSNAVKGLSSLLTRTARLENHNGLLMSVILLYIHGCMGRGTYTDIPRHVNAATRILTLRLFSLPLDIERPFDRLAVESVLYQIFLVTTGLWSNPVGLDYDFDAAFWARAARLLDQSTLFPGRSQSLNSPVLGIPVVLFQLALSVKQQYQSPSQRNQYALDQLRSDLEGWEALVLCDEEFDALSPDEDRTYVHRYYRDAGYLYVLVASLLLEQLTSSTRPSQVPPPAPSDCWQVRKALAILRAHQYDDGWACCYIANWPVYTLGFFLAAPDEVEFVRQGMRKRWDLTKFAQLARYSRDLEKEWEARGGGGGDGGLGDGGSSSASAAAATSDPEGVGVV